MPAQPGRGDPPRLQQRAPAHAQVGVEQRRVVEDEALLAARSAAAVDQLQVGNLQQPLGQVQWVADGGGRAEEARRRAVELTDPLQAAHHVGDLGAEHAAVGVQLVDDHVLQRREEAPPPRVVGQDAGVQHVGIGEHDVARLPDLCAPPRRGVAVVGVGADLDRESGGEGAELGQLILRQGLGGEQVEGPRGGLLQDPLQDGQVVAEGLSAGRGCDHDQVSTLPYGGVGPRLMRVESVDPPAAKGSPQRLRQVVGELTELGWTGGNVVVEGDISG